MSPTLTENRAGLSGLWRIAVVPAYNEQPTVVGILDKLYGLVDELVVVDDGSTDATRDEVERWLPGHPHAQLLWFDTNRGMSAAYHLAFTQIAGRVQAGELSEDTLVCTVDADGQHELAALDDLVRIAHEERADAVIARRELTDYPAIKRLGNVVLSRWASFWAGAPLPDVESGYRVFRAGALAHALRYYRGYKYSETVEVAVVLCRLGYRVHNQLLIPVPVIRSRTRLRDAVIDVVMIVVAARRAGRAPVSLRRPRLTATVRRLANGAHAAPGGVSSRLALAARRRNQPRA
jgi:glycosyltransferase involved in cell wall biosynthesis